MGDIIRPTAPKLIQDQQGATTAIIKVITIMLTFIHMQRVVFILTRCLGHVRRHNNVRRQQRDTCLTTLHRQMRSLLEQGHHRIQFCRSMMHFK